MAIKLLYQEMAVIRFVCFFWFAFSFITPTKGQELTLQKGINLHHAFSMVSKAYGVNFAYNPNTLDRNTIIPQNLTITSPIELLESELSENYAWKYVGNTIVISLAKSATSPTPSKVLSKDLQPTSKSAPVVHERDTPAFSLKEISGIATTENLSKLGPPFDLESIQPIAINETEETIKNRKKVIWKHQPYVSMFNYQLTKNEEGSRPIFYGLGGGMNISVHKGKWYLSASIAYNRILNGYPIVIQDSIAVIDSVLHRTDTLAKSVAHLKSFIKYSGSVGYNFRVSPTLTIPVEFGVSALQVLNTSEGYNRMLYNGHLAIPITLNSKRTPLAITPFLEVGINNEFKEIAYKNKRLLLGLKIGLKL